MALPRLPPELLDIIVSYLSPNENSFETSVLYACALTCKALVSPAQTCIFRSLSLPSSICVPIAKVKLESTPRIRKLIKRVLLVEYRHPWISQAEELPHLLRMLCPSVISLDIFQRRDKQETPRFNYPSLAELKCLEEIKLREEENGPPRHGDIAFPTLLQHFPKLRAVTFDVVETNRVLDGNDGVNSMKIAAPVFQLDFLEVQYCDDAVLLDWLVPALRFLRTFRIWYPTPECLASCAAVVRFTVAAGTSLQHLEVVSVNNATDADLRALMSAIRTYSKNLRSLSLMVDGNISERSPIQVIIKSLTFLDAHPHIEHITIQCFQRNTFVEGNPWSDLEDVLLDTRFPALRSVELRLLLYNFNDVPAAAIEPYIAVVPRLRQKRMIFVCHARWGR
ncbi:hypothetical protein GALMADRAFT_148197 [Galerina marginata CBS 339.88]|uniref:F-box domain-containing protein n=1 Tax=Galerina marginata (strain CBS 339.88) TaxID=685588 RepID=A0A067SE82_GALM3|nr:hypothetical protein GALMADRAFT_148197 [Galerina marginata CBS 339.88]